MNNRTFIFEFSFRLRRNMMIWKAGNHLTLCLVYIIMLINKTGVWLALKAFFTELLWLYYRQLTIMVKFCLRVGQRTLNWLHVDPRALLRVTTREDELWGTLEQNCLRLASAKTKTKKLFWLVHSNSHESGWMCGVSGLWAGFSLEILK